MDISVRAVRETDTEAIHSLLMSDHTRYGSMRVPFQPFESTVERLKPVDGTIRIVAVAEGEVVGFAEMVTYPPHPRHRHVSHVNLIVTHSAFQGKGVGRCLMESLVDLCDRWINIHRMELTVWTTNERAIALYESLGFEIEGTMRDFVFTDGEYRNAHLMGRIRDQTPDTRHQTTEVGVPRDADG